MLSFNLKNGVTSSLNPQAGGYISFGFDNIGDALFPLGFNLLDKYGYLGEPSITPVPPYDLNKVLGFYKDGQAETYFGIAYEHLNPSPYHYQVQPQPFPNFGLYFHPSDTPYKKNLIARFKIPFDGVATTISKVQRATFGCGSNIGYTVKKGLVDLTARTIISPTDGIVTLTNSGTFLAGDEIDFIVDSGNDGTDSCDDTAVDITIELNYTKIPTPIILTTNVNCETTTIEGTTNFVENGTVVKLFNGTTEIGSTVVNTPVGQYVGTFSLSPLDLSTQGNTNLTVVLSDGVATDSDPVIIPVENIGCEEVITVLKPPVVVNADLCKKKCSYQKKISGTADFNGIVFIYKSPLNLIANEIIAVGNILGGVWEVWSEKLKSNDKYIAYGVRYDGTAGGVLEITNSQCEAECKLVGIFNGTAQGIVNGIVSVFTAPYSSGDLPIANGVIKNGLWEIKDEAILTDKDYILFSTEIKNLI